MKYLILLDCTRVDLCCEHNLVKNIFFRLDIDFSVINSYLHFSMVKFLWWANHYMFELNFMFIGTCKLEQLNSLI